ncbi:MAG TPA: hypothetical protein VJT49_34850 [Amycolatopsis sp.]|nr:hypothetical protein [Amycolatopsis sp.]HKS50201.1 hypothetical protein [Amycolatopsis sp.]
MVLPGLVNGHWHDLGTGGNPWTSTDLAPSARGLARYDSEVRLLVIRAE